MHRTRISGNAQCHDVQKHLSSRQHLPCHLASVKAMTYTCFLSYTLHALSGSYLVVPQVQLFQNHALLSRKPAFCASNLPFSPSSLHQNTPKATSQRKPPKANSTKVGQSLQKPTNQPRKATTNAEVIKTTKIDMMPHKNTSSHLVTVHDPLQVCQLNQVSSNYVLQGRLVHPNVNFKGKRNTSRVIAFAWQLRKHMYK